ncbi:MAG: sarcosine oxidase subunit delta [Bradyrhizobium sp.]|uniref:sarcosine oxidase subunit delta n=1 Tax=Bradyrhizobium sp. TaxID=376 RepID=UPI0025C0251D|nr:sarcosine oxidase subunit delta [Bradyrhizobium sp.]MBI5263354.1 sarcosine oxidase subunit delta [Bradyrhizobium sp.]
MRIPCPYCGSRDLSEFVYHGDAAPKRPDPAAENASELFYTYVYLRENPAGPLRELWYHASGCRSWLIVTRDTRTHDIAGAVLAMESAS